MTCGLVMSIGWRRAKLNFWKSGSRMTKIKPMRMKVRRAEPMKAAVFRLRTLMLVGSFRSDFHFVKFFLKRSMLVTFFSLFIIIEHHF